MRRVNQIDDQKEYLRIMVSHGLYVGAGVGLLAWTVGFIYSAYTEPCINQPNKYAVEACALFSLFPYKIASSLGLLAGVTDAVVAFSAPFSA